MQDEWQEEFKNKLNEELKLEGVTADNHLIQKTLLAVSETGKPSKQEAEERTETQRKKKNGNHFNRTHNRRLGWIFAKTAAVLCVMILTLLAFRQEGKNKNSEFNIADSIQKELSGSWDGSSEIEELENIQGTDAIQDGQTSTGSEGNLDLLQSGQQAEDSESGSASQQDKGNPSKPEEALQESETVEDKPKDKLLSGEWDTLSVAVPGGKSRKLSAGETEGNEIISCLQKAVPQTGMEKTDWTTMTAIYEITVSSGEKALSLTFCQGGYLIIEEGEEEQSIWKLPEPKILEELLTNLS